MAALVVRLPVIEVAVFASPGSRSWRVRGASVRIGLLGHTSQVQVREPMGRLARPKLLAFAAAGPLMSFVVGGGLFALTSSLDLAPLARGTLLMIGAVSIVIGITTLVPGHTRSSEKTDGLMIVTLLWPKMALGRQTRRVLAELQQRAAKPGNRWRTFDDLNAVMKARAEASSQEVPM